MIVMVLFFVALSWRALVAEDAATDSASPYQIAPSPEATPIPSEADPPVQASDSTKPSAATENTGPVWKLMRPDAISLEARFGSVFWSGFSWPVDASGATVKNTNGINGKNFLFPVIPIVGLGSRISLGPLLRLAPSVDFLFDEYVYRADLDRAFRTQSMTGKAVGPVATVMGILASVPVWFDLPLADRAVLSLAPGVAFYPRVAVAALDKSENIDKISTDLNKEGRWFYPQTGVAFHYALGDWMSAGVQVQVMYPLYHAWATDGLPFHDAMMVVGTLGFDFYF